MNNWPMFVDSATLRCRIYAETYAIAKKTNTHTRGEALTRARQGYSSANQHRRWYLQCQRRENEGKTK
jgi:hypothetical protein